MEYKVVYYLVSLLKSHHIFQTTSPSLPMTSDYFDFIE